MRTQTALVMIGFFVMEVSRATAQSSDSVMVHLSIQNSLVSKRSDMHITVIAQSNSIKPIVMAKYPSWGFLYDSIGAGYFSIEVQKKRAHTYKNIRLDARIDDIPALWPPDTLQRKDTKESDFSIGGCFRPDEGDYRVRVRCFVSTDNPGIKDAYSNWVYFHCEKNVKMFPGN